MKILVLTCYYKSFNNASSIDIVKKIDILKKISQKIDIVTVYLDKEELIEKEENITIHRIKNKFIRYHSEIQRKAVGKKEEKVLDKVKFKIRKKLMEYFILPDNFIFWVKPAMSYIERSLKIEDYDYVISMGQPNSSYLLGMKLKIKFPNIKFITYWNDPWFANLKTYWFGRNLFEKYLEQQVIKKSDYFIVFSEEFIDRLTQQSKVKRKNIFKIEGVYDYFKKSEKINRERISILHTGDIYLPIRNISPFIEAIKEIKKEKRDFPLEFTFIGNIKDRNFFNELEKFENIKILGQKSYKECLEYSQKTDMFLLFGNKGVNRVPSKVFDYIAYDKPILTILGDENDPTAKIFSNQKRGPIIKNEITIIKKTLLHIKENMNEWEDICSKELEEFKSTNIAFNLYKWLMSKNIKGEKK